MKTLYAFDVDRVVLDFEQAYIDSACDLFGEQRFIHLINEPISLMARRLKLTPDEALLVRKNIKYEEMRPLQDFVSFYQRYKHLADSFCFVSALSNSQRESRAKNLTTFFPEIEQKQVYCIGNIKKSQCIRYLKADFFIDDNPSNVQEVLEKTNCDAYALVMEHNDLDYTILEPDRLVTSVNELFENKIAPKMGL